MNNCHSIPAFQWPSSLPTITVTTVWLCTIVFFFPFGGLHVITFPYLAHPRFFSTHYRLIAVVWLISVQGGKRVLLWDCIILLKHLPSLLHLKCNLSAQPAFCCVLVCLLLVLKTAVRASKPVQVNNEVPFAFSGLRWSLIVRNYCENYNVS